MKLERMHIQGFKSFKDHTTIHFDDGITGIVGPNGCGKSNIVDALFWVMGEQSAKHLRGTKMSDLIFSGSKKYSPGSFAEVSLVLNNTKKKHIHIGSKVVSPSEIQLTRKLYKSGDTEYRINNMPARLKDIQEVFMDTGAGAKSYSIIAQGEIDRLVKAKPVERRVMIEEVAGITKFKVRKKESLRKIDQTNVNLERISDLKKEIYKQLKTLEGQAEKAERARSLRDKIKKSSLIVSSHKELDLIEKVKNLSDEITTSEESLEDNKIKLASIEAEIETEKNKKTTLIDKIDKDQEEFNNSKMELVSLEEKFNFSKKSLEDKNNYIEEKEQEIEYLTQEVESRSEKLEEVALKLENIEDPSSNSGNDIAFLEEELKKFENNFKEDEKSYLNFQDAQRDLESRQTKAETELTKTKSLLENKSHLLDSIVTEIQELEAYYLEVNNQDADNRKKLEAFEVEAVKLEERRVSLEKSAESLKLKISELDDELREKQKEEASLSAKSKALKEILNNSNDKFLESKIGSGFKQLKTCISVTEENELIVNNLLNPYLNIMVGDAKDSEVSEWAHEQQANIQILKNVPYNTNSEGHKTLDMIVGCEDDRVKNFLSYFIVESEECPDGFLASTGSGYVIQRKVGEVFISEFKESDEISFFKRDLDYKKTLENLEIIQDKLVNLEKNLNKTKAEYSIKKEELVTLKNKEQSKKEEVIRTKAMLNSSSTQFNVNQDRLVNLQKRNKNLSVERFSLNESEEECAAELLKVEKERLELESSKDSIFQKYEKSQKIFREKQEDLIKIKTELKASVSRKDELESLLDDLKNQKLRASEKIESLKTSIEESKTAAQEINEKESEYSERIAELSGSLGDKEKALKVLKEELNILSKKLEKSENEIQKLNSSISKSDRTILEKTLKLEKAVEDEEILSRDIFEQFRVDLRSVICAHLEIENPERLNDVSNMYYVDTDAGAQRVEGEVYEFNKKFPGQVSETKDRLKNYKSQLGRLGHVNWEAVSDYDEKKKRYDFLKDQEEELSHSINDLLKAIEHIDSKSKERFKIAFDEVNGKFEQVFPIIFGGGNAKLQMHGKLEDEDFGVEIIASPPGKKMQNINLMSGGEKALTAVALIFSIFLVKPSPFCLLDEVDAPLDDANVGRFNQLLREMSSESQFILITHNKKTMELNDKLYGITMQEPGVSKAVSVQLQ